MDLTLIIARVSQRLDIDAAGADKPGPVGMVVNRPRGGASLKVTERR